jgi:hypothetical protein
MAKRKARPVIDWNGLTVTDIHGIITHFEDAERYYMKEISTRPAADVPVYMESSLPIVRERQRFWKEMIPYVERGEKITSKVREHVSYCRNRVEF